MCIAFDIEHVMQIQIQDSASRKPDVCVDHKPSPACKTLFDEFYGCSKGKFSCCEEVRSVDGQFSFLNRDAITASAESDPRLSSVLVQLSSF
mmetsp:Transcript_25648/g.84718  ORF Transcript_25648/g.84718 Transcript_25648/m.84718 type:complete len:92 (+) Transcript_25648:761-1036(+)